jgi:hypothetical protein
MPIPPKKKDENPKTFCVSKGRGAYIYEDPKTGELYHYSRRGIYKKDGRKLIFVKQTRGNTMAIDFIKEVDEFLQKKNNADEKAGYPPNCNEGYVEKDGKCVPAETDS